MTDKELEEFIHHGETGFVAFAMMFGEGWAQRAIDIAKELRARLAQPNDFNPDWDAMAVMVEEQQRMAKLIEELEARLAQGEPEPVAWGVPNTRPTEKDQFMMLLHSTDGCQYPDQLVPLYTAPPQREFVGLTDEEIRNEANHHVFDESFFNGAVWARGKIKEKNNG